MDGDRQRDNEPDMGTDVYDDEEVPTLVLIIVGALAVLTAVLYLWLGGGHNHFH
jgi:hypothetical protein